MPADSSKARGLVLREKGNAAQGFIFEEIMKQSFRNEEEGGQHAFITQHLLLKIWKDELLVAMFAGMDVLHEPFFSRIRDSHVRIMSILVVMGWSQWSRFRAIFIDQPGRTDADLPLRAPAISDDYFDAVDAKNFIRWQSHFLPVTLLENEDRDLESDVRMPFEKKPETVSNKGSFCTIEEVIIASRQYRNRQGELNVNPKKLIRKVCYVNNPQQSLKKEQEILSQLRKALFNDERVMRNIGTIDHLGTSRTLSIFFPRAEFDLDDYLFGKKNSDKVQQYPVNPIHLIEEFAGLTHALDYLHNGIWLSDGGEHYVCVHHDLKPDNILVVAEPGAPVGRWKVTDFGLSRLKEAQRPSTTTTLYDQIPSFRASLTSPKRKQGTFQPPEIEMSGEKVMGPKSDIWALGCILCLVLMYAIKGTPAVKDFQSRRARQRGSRGSGSSNYYEHDYFYRGNQINPEVVNPLRQASQEARWVKTCVDIIYGMLSIEPSDRPKAKTVEVSLLEKVVHDELKNPGLEERSNVRGRKQSDAAEASTSHRRSEDGPTATLSNPQLHISNESTSEEAMSVASVSSWAPYRKFRIPKLDTKYATFKIEGISKQTSISNSCEYVAFLFEAEVYVHSTALLDAHDRWMDKPSKNRVKKDEGTFKVISAPRNTLWRAMSLSGAYLAVRGCTKNERRECVYVFELSVSPGYKTTAECVFEVNDLSSLLGVEVSPRGDFLLQSAKDFVFYSRAKNWKAPSKIDVKGLKSVVFSTDGNWIFAWSDDKKTMYSHFRAVDNVNEESRGRLRNQPDQAPEALTEHIIPFASLPAFVVFDQLPGRIRFLQGQSLQPKETLSWETLSFIKAGVVTPQSNAIVLARRHEKWIGDVLQFNMISFDQDSDGTLELQQAHKLYESKIKLDSEKNPCDIALKVDNHSGLLRFIFTTYLDGTVEKTSCAYPQSQ